MSSYLWSLMIGPAVYFTGFLFDDVTSEWADDLIRTLLCWVDLSWCWLYSTMLELLYTVVEEALPVMPEFVIESAQILNYFDYINRVVPVVEAMILFTAWLPFYIIVRVLYIAQPWAG